MFQNDYRREMDGLRPSPAAVERLNRLLEEGAPARRPRRLGRRAAAALAEQYAGMLYRLAYARTGSRADAEDVMQEVFVRLLRARPEFRDEEHAKAWLLRVGARCAADVLRAPWRRREGPLDDGLPAPEPPGEGGVVEAVLALPAKYRAAVHLYYYEELSVAEIAAVLGKSEGAVKSRLFRARALLRRYLKEDSDVSERL